jgi:ABC-type transport system involved in cytochrome c biogenesis permease subunit
LLWQGATIERPARSSRSVAVAAMLHLIFNFGRHLPGTYAWWALGISAIVWIVLFRTWPVPAHTSVAATDG